MNFLETAHLQDLLHGVSQGMLVPVVVLLLALLAFALYAIGSVIVEAVVERRRYRVVLPRFIDALDGAGDISKLKDVIAHAELLDSQRAALAGVVDHFALPDDALGEVARRAYQDENDRYQRSLVWTDMAAKIAPMLGLMGTLIPLGPGLVGLGSNDLTTLSSALIVAFDTTVAGLATAVVCMIVSRIRSRWYQGYLIDLEGALNTLLEKARLVRDGGWEQSVPRPLAESDGAAPAGAAARPTADGLGATAVGPAATAPARVRQEEGA